MGQDEMTMIQVSKETRKELKKFVAENDLASYDAAIIFLMKAVKQDG